MGADYIETSFPRLRGDGYHITSRPSDSQNCIGLALYADLYFDPGLGGFLEGTYWPEGIRRDDSVEAWIELFTLHGYRECDGDHLEPGIEKVAIYDGDDGDASHVARQLESGAWTSKLNKLEDIEHQTLAGLISPPEYRRVVKVMSRPRRH